MAVMVGIAPQKGSRTAVAVGAAGELPGKLRVRACPGQAGKLGAWARAWPERTWAVDGARGLGRLLARQLAAAGERVALCGPSWLPGSGCRRPATRTRPARTMPGRWRSRRRGPGAARR